MASRSFYRRQFLNRRGRHAGAFVLADIHPDIYMSKGEQVRAVSAFLTIADCTRMATLDFDVHTAADARNALFKARRLREVVSAFVDALEEEIADRHRPH